MSLVQVNADNFNAEVKDSKTPVIVDFWAPWCGPCQQLGPVFEELSKDYEGKLKFVKVNVDENQEIAGEVGVQGIPTLLVLSKGEEIDRLVGAMPKEMLKQKIDDALSKVK